MDICDFHAHILPGVDHGSASIEESLAQLALATRCGVKRIVATSHFYPHRDTVDSFVSKRDKAYGELRERLAPGAPEIRLGAEILLCANIDEMPGIERLCVQGTNTLLIELPFNDFGNEYVHAVEGLIDKGYRVVLAHAECYDIKNVDRILAIGALVQLNASALLPLFIKPVFKSWMRRKKIVAIGSDIHGVDKRAYKRFLRAVKRLKDYASFVEQESNNVWI